MVVQKPFSRHSYRTLNMAKKLSQLIVGNKDMSNWKGAGIRHYHMYINRVHPALVNVHFAGEHFSQRYQLYLSADYTRPHNIHLKPGYVNSIDKLVQSYR